MDSTFCFSAGKKLIASALLIIFGAALSQAQTFSNNTVEICNTWDSGNQYTGFQREITVSGLPTLESYELCGELSGTALRQVNLHLGESACRANLTSWSARIISPSGTIIQLFTNFATSTNNLWCDISFRDDASLERVKDYSATFQNNYQPFSIGYYRTETADAFDAVLGEDPNGTWLFQIQENGTFEIQFQSIELVFGTPITAFDGTSNANNSCSGAYCIDGFNPVVGTINGYSQNDPFYPASPVNGCTWNAANNNSAWFSFIPTSTTAYISISGTLNTTGASTYDIQPIVVQAPSSCSVPTVVPTGGCPAGTINNQAYTLTNGGGSFTPYFNGISANCEFNLSGLIPNQEYYLYIDGNGNPCSSFYIEMIGNTVDCTPNGLIVDPTFNAVASLCQGSAGPTLPSTSLNGITGTWSPSATVSTAQAGTFDYTFTPGQGICASVYHQTIVVTAQPTASVTTTNNLTQLSCTTTSLTLTASGGTSYTWANGLGSNPSITVSTPGTYSVTVSNGGVCNAVQNVVITNNTTPPVAGITNQSGFTQLDCNNSSVSLLATGGGTYSWNNGLGSAAAATATTAGTYTVTVTGTNGCTDTESITVTSNNTPPTAGITNNTGITALTCVQTSISLTGTGGVSYSWNNGLGNNANATVTTAGTYTVTVTGSNGCTDTESITITSNGATPTATITNNSNTTVLTCSETSISLTGGGGVSYSWSNGLGSNASATVTTPGTYVVTATAANGCTDTESITITQSITPPPAAIVNNTGSTILTCTTNAISVTGTGGVSYSWSNGLGNNASANITSAGTYTVTVTGADGCTDTENITITQNTTPPTASITNNSGETTITCEQTSISLTATGGVALLWNTGSPSANISVTQGGTYTVTVTGTNGCTDTESITIAQDNQAPVVGVAELENLSCENPISTLNNYNVTNTTNWSADWIGPDSFDSSLNYPTTDEPGTYFLTITDDNTGCETTVEIVLAEDFPAEVLLSDVLFPNVLSNNRDNKNFEWRPFLYYAPTVDIADVLNDYELFIFDRWGHEVFASSPGKTSWEPDENIQSGVYYYVIRFSTKCPVSQPAERTGHIQVLAE